MTLIQLYKGLTLVKVGNGQDTSFWLDSWLGNKSLSEQYLTLFSHVQRCNLMVVDAYSEIGWRLCFRHISSQRAEGELTALLARLDGVVLNEEPDTRQMRFGPGKEFSVKNCYYAMNFELFVIMIPPTTGFSRMVVWTWASPE
jgi:hypothetical protein